MPLVQVLSAALAWLGRQGTRALAASIFLGIALPALAALVRPFLAEVIFLLLCLAFVRVEPGALRGHFERPALALAATFWIMVAVPLVLGGVFLTLGLAHRMPELMFALILQAAAPPILSAPALAALLRLDVALTLAVLILTFIVTPLAAPVFAESFLGAAVAFSPVALGIKLFLLLAGAALAAALIRRLAGQAWIRRQRERIDGLNAIGMAAFAIAVMDGVGERILREPFLVLGLIGLAFALSLGIMGMTMLAFGRAGRARAFALGLAAGHRNMGFMVAALGGSVPDLTWLYFGLSQFPIYLLPQLLRPLARRWAPVDEPVRRTRDGGKSRF